MADRIPLAETAQSIGTLAASVVNRLAEKTGRVRQFPTFVEQIPITDRASWLAHRRKDVTASGAAALLGVHPFVTAYGLWAEKTGAIPQDDEMTAAMERGIELEPIAIKRLAKTNPDWQVEEPGAYYRDPITRLGATPDAFAHDPSRPGFGVVQIKSVEPSKFRKDWRNEDGDTEPPLWIVVQAIIEAHLTGASWASVAALVISYGIELHVVDVPLHGGVIERIKAETSAFWQMIEEGRRPDPDYGGDAGLIAKLFSDPADVEVDFRLDNSLPALADQDQELGRVIAESTKERKRIRAEILHKLGNAERARIAGDRLITAKLVRRKGYVVAPSEHREIRIKEVRS